MVFVTGYSNGIATSGDYATVAYDSATGTALWVRRYDGDSHGYDQALGVAVSPDGLRVYVTGFSYRLGTNYDYATAAYDAVTGAFLWANRYNGTGDDYDFPSSIAVSPDGSAVFVTGESVGSSSGFDWATAAYHASDGSSLWGRRYNGPGNADDPAASVKVSPNGTIVYVAGYSRGITGGSDYTTAAYDASTGAGLWARRYNGPRNADDAATSLAVSPDGSKVFATGSSIGTTSSTDYATVTYDGMAGTSLWLSRYNGPGNSADAAFAIGVSPDGSTVFVTGDSRGIGNNEDWGTVAYVA
jgi:hypothetical protein